MKRCYVDTPEGQVHYRTEGSGKPLLLLHQAWLSSDQYSETIPILGKSYRVVAMDVLGYGNSDMPPYRYQVEDYARSVINFLDALNIKKTSVVGHLFGSSLAVEMAVSHPARVDKLVLSSCPYYEQEVRKARQSDPKYKPMEIKEDGSHLMEKWERLRSISPYLKPEVVQRILVDYLRAGLGTRAEDAHVALYSYNIEPRLSLIKSPTLLIYRANDSFYNRIEATKNLIPRCQVKIIEGVNFLPSWEKPEEFSRAILEFLGNPKR